MNEGFVVFDGIFATRGLFGTRWKLEVGGEKAMEVVVGVVEDGVRSEAAVAKER